MDFNCTSWLSPNGLLTVFDPAGMGGGAGGGEDQGGSPVFPKLQEMCIDKTGDRNLIIRTGLDNYIDLTAAKYEEWNFIHDADGQDLKYCGVGFFEPKRLWECFVAMPQLDYIILGVHPEDEEHARHTVPVKTLSCGDDATLLVGCMRRRRDRDFQWEAKTEYLVVSVHP